MKERQAINLLFHPEAYPGMVRMKASDVKLILWRNDTLSEYVSWSFIETDDRHILRRTIWKQHTAYDLVEPEIFCADAIISKSKFVRLLDSFARFNLSCTETTEPGVSIDGIEYGIILQKEKFKWSNESKLNCHELIMLYENTISEIEAFFRPV